MNAKLDYLFIFPQISAKKGFQGFEYHLGAAYMRAYLHTQGYRTEQFIHPGNAPLDHLVELIVRSNPRIIGFSCYDSNYFLVKLLADRVRGLTPAPLIVCGGPTATFSDRVILDDADSVDVCVRYYGEIASMEILQWLKGERAIETIPGISYRLKKGIRRARDRTSLEAFSPFLGDRGNAPASLLDCKSLLDVFPDPYLSGVLPPHVVSRVGLVTSRGCTFPCTYCNFSAMSRRKITYHSEDRIIAVLRALDESLAGRKGGRSVIPVNDDNFSLNKKRFHSLLKRIIRERFRNIRFFAELRTESLTEQSFKLLRKARFIKLHFGLESAVPRVLATIKKVRACDHEADGYEKERNFLKRISWAVNLSHKAGLQTNVSVILGLPGESEQDGRATLEFVDRLRVTEYAHNLLQVLDGTEAMTHCEEFGIRVIPTKGTILPRLTLYAYDVFQLPIHANAEGRFSIDGIGMFLALKMLTGTVGNPQAGSANPGSDDNVPSDQIRGNGRHDSGPPIIVLLSETPTSSLCRWLEREMPLSATIWLRYESKESRETCRNMLVDGGAPILDINALRLESTDNAGRAWRVNELSVTAPRQNTCMVHELPFSQADALILSRIARELRSNALLSILTAEDVDSLLRLVQSGEDNGALRLSASYLISGVSIADGCRWNGPLCPAVKGMRWFVDREEYLRPCLNGCPLGQVGDSFANLVSSAEAAMEEQVLARGCKECSAEPFCSKCLYPFPVTQQEFCRIRRRHTGLPALVGILSCIPRLRYASVLSAKESEFLIRSLRYLKADDFPWWRATVPLSEFLLLRGASSRAGVLYHTGRNLLVRLSQMQTESLERGAHQSRLFPDSPSEFIASFPY